MRTLAEIIQLELIDELEEEWDRCMEEGLTIEKGTTYILEQYKELVEEEQEVLIYLALGLIQLELEEVDDRVKAILSDLMATKKIELYLVDHIDNKKLIQQIKKRLR